MAAHAEVIATAVQCSDSGISSKAVTKTATNGQKHTFHGMTTELYSLSTNLFDVSFLLLSK